MASRSRRHTAMPVVARTVVAAAVVLVAIEPHLYIPSTTAFSVPLGATLGPTTLRAHDGSSTQRRSLVVLRDGSLFGEPEVVIRVSSTSDDKPAGSSNTAGAGAGAGAGTPSDGTGAEAEAGTETSDVNAEEGAFPPVLDSKGNAFTVGGVVRVCTEGVKAFHVGKKMWGSYDQDGGAFTTSPDADERADKCLKLPAGLRGIVTYVYNVDEVSSNLPVKVVFEPDVYTEEGFSAPGKFIMHFDLHEVEVVVPDS